MYLRLGNFDANEGENVLRLSTYSCRMNCETWVNLEQRYCIEWSNLDHWNKGVTVDYGEFSKLDMKLDKLEADQNRFIYKPLYRDLSRVLPGAVLLMRNPTGRSSPVLVIANDCKKIRFIRVKAVEENRNLQPGKGPGKHHDPRHLCLRIGKHPEKGHDDTPVLYLERDSPTMALNSYVEASTQERWATIDKFKTWCYPHVRIQPGSMKNMLAYIGKLPEADKPPRSEAPKSQQVVRRDLRNRAQPNTNSNSQTAPTRNGHSIAPPQTATNQSQLHYSQNPMIPIQYPLQRLPGQQVAPFPRFTAPVPLPYPPTASRVPSTMNAAYNTHGIPTSQQPARTIFQQWNGENPNSENTPHTTGDLHNDSSTSSSAGTSHSSSTSWTLVHRRASH
jgi:hypothetical protein